MSMAFFKKIKKIFEAGFVPPLGRFQRISRAMLSTQLSTARPAFWMLRPTGVFIRAPGMMQAAAAPATSPALMPTQKSVCLSITRPPFRLGLSMAR